MKKVLSILLTVSLVFALVGCGSQSSDKLKPTAKNKTLTSFVEAIKKADKNKADKYGDYDAVEKELDISGLKMNDDEKKALVKAAFSDLEVVIRTVEDKDDHTKVITADLSTKDLTSALDTAVRNMYSYAQQHFTKAKNTDDLQHQNYEIFLEAINDKNLKTVENTVTFTVEKKDGKWKVKTDSAAVNSLYGGYVVKRTDTINQAYSEFNEQLQQQSSAIDVGGNEAK